MVPLMMDPLTGGPYIDDTFMTSKPGVFICGNAAFVNDLADYVSLEGETAGESAAKFAVGNYPNDARITTVAGQNVRFVTPNFISRNDCATLYIRVKYPMTDVRITSTNNVIHMVKQIVKPSEMIEIKLDGEMLKKIKALKEFRIDVGQNN
jgi:hypothetical protein